MVVRSQERNLHFSIRSPSTSAAKESCLNVLKVRVTKRAFLFGCTIVTIETMSKMKMKHSYVWTLLQKLPQ